LAQATNRLAGHATVIAQGRGGVLGGSLGRGGVLGGGVLAPSGPSGLQAAGA